MNPWLIGILLALNIYIAWRYSKTEADPDWAMFNLAAFTGSWYGRDWCDCKTPGIHIWYWLISKTMKTPTVAGVKFINHFAIGAAGVIFYMVTGQFIPALVYTIMINSGWMWAFHGNVSQLPAALLFMVGMLTFSRQVTEQLGTAAAQIGKMGIGATAHLGKDGVTAGLWIATLVATLLVITVLIEPKLLPTAIAIAIIQEVPAWIALTSIGVIGLGCFATVGIIALATNQSAMRILGWIWEGSVTIPLRMSKNRKGLYGWMPWWTAKAMLYFMPWLLISIQARPDLTYWLPPLIYIIVISTGQVIRQNHLLPIIPWIACAGIPVEFALGLTCIDYFSAGFYLGDIWTRFYRVFGDNIRSAKAAGEYLKDKPGTIWVDGMHTEVYIYARKPVPFGLAEQIEIREVNHERREKMHERWRKNPADYVIMTEAPNVKFNPKGYGIIANNSYTQIWRKII